MQDIEKGALLRSANENHRAKANGGNAIAADRVASLLEQYPNTIDELMELCELTGNAEGGTMAATLFAHAAKLVFIPILYELHRANEPAPLGLDDKVTT